MALAKDTLYTHAGRRVEAYPVTDTVQIYAGSLVGINITTGLLDKWQDVAAMKFLGVALRSVLGTAVAPLPESDVDCSGTILKKATCVGVGAQTAVGDLVFASDDNTLTLTPSANVGAIGCVTRWYSSTTCDVRLFTPAEYRALVGA